jgi:hypothetical protein
MIVAGSASPLLLASAGGYTLTRSLRFRSSASAYLNRTPASASNLQTWTWSAWIKRGTLGATQNLFGTTTEHKIYISGGDALNFQFDNGTFNYRIATTQVFRDPSAWYHVMVVWNTTSATTANRMRFYVNGSEVTTLSVSNYPTQNFNGGVNTTVAHYLGNLATTQYFDGYLTEVNFIDGQALTPSSFGSNSTTTGVWQPKKFVGTYGTNGFYLPFTSSQYGLSMFATSATGFSTFAGSFITGDPTGTQLNLPANATNLAIGTGDFTVEGFVNTTVNGRGSLIGIGTANATGSLWFGWEDNSTTYVRFGSTDVISTGLSLSSAGWVHIAVTRSGSTVRLYKNGSLVASGTSSANLNLTDISSIGGYAKTEASGYTLQGSLSNVRLVVGTALYTGSTYTVPTSALTAVSGTQLLTLQNSPVRDNSANNYALTAVQPFVLDASGNANNWQPNGINVVTAGSTYDSMTDVPTLTSATASNYATLNPLSFGGTVSEANLRAANASDYSVLSTMGATGGKFYWELVLNNGTNGDVFGINSISSKSPTETTSRDSAGFWGVQNNNTNNWYENGVAVTKASAVPTITAGQIVQIAVDTVNNKYWIGVNNSWWLSGDPSAGTNPISSNLTANATWLAYSQFRNASSNITYNFGQRPFAYTPPTGFVALNTFNLPTPTIGATASTQANKYFDAQLWTGNGSSQTLTTAGSFSPDFVWIKSRSGANSHFLTDTVRGATKTLFTNSTGAEATETQGLTAFTSTGFTVGSDASVNSNGSSYVGWTWDANGTGVSNTAGSITSTVSANTSAGFSVVTYTGNGTNGATVGHGLGVAPKMMIIKKRSASGDNWRVYHASLGATKFLDLNQTSAAGTASSVWNDTTPSSTVWTVGTNGEVNTSSATYVAYCFSAIAGYSAMGSYTGNGSTDGTFVYTGFRPRFVMVKAYSSAGSAWEIIDTARDTYNVTNDSLRPNSSAAEVNGTYPDILSNGFKARSTDGYFNDSGVSYIYYAVAENPFKYSLAR